MKKALMYLLLALGITLGVVFVCGAVMGFVAGYMDGWNENRPGTTSPADLMSLSLLLAVVMLGGVLNWVFLRYGFASYSLGRIPLKAWWRVLPLLMLAMAGVALLFATMYNPLAEADGTPLTETDQTVHAYYQWLKSHPLQAFPRGLIIEATANLVVYGAVLRELLEWKHRPEVVIPVFASVAGLLSGLATSPLLMTPAMITILIEGWTYECSRSVVPVILGDMFYWAVLWCLIGPEQLPGWCFPLAAAIIIPSVYFLVKAMDPYKPID